MYCKNCGVETKEGAAFCENCGMGAGQGNSYCANCGAALVPGARVCTQCGNEVNVAAAQPEQPVAEAETENGGNGLSITGMVLSILSLVGCCGIVLPLGIAGIICSAIALGKKKPGRGMAIAGLIVGIVSVVVGIIVLCLYAAVIYAAVNSGNFNDLMNEITSGLQM